MVSRYEDFIRKLNFEKVVSTTLYANIFFKDLMLRPRMTARGKSHLRKLRSLQTFDLSSIRVGIERRLDWTGLGLEVSQCSFRDIELLGHMGKLYLLRDEKI